MQYDCYVGFPRSEEKGDLPYSTLKVVEDVERGFEESGYRVHVSTSYEEWFHKGYDLFMDSCNFDHMVVFIEYCLSFGAMGGRSGIITEEKDVIYYRFEGDDQLVKAGVAIQDAYKRYLEHRNKSN